MSDETVYHKNGRTLHMRRSDLIKEWVYIAILRGQDGLNIYIEHMDLEKFLYLSENPDLLLDKTSWEEVFYYDHASGKWSMTTPYDEVDSAAHHLADAFGDTFRVSPKLIGKAVGSRRVNDRDLWIAVFTRQQYADAFEKLIRGGFWDYEVLHTYDGSDPVLAWIEEFLAGFDKARKGR